MLTSALVSWVSIGLMAKDLEAFSAALLGKRLVFSNIYSFQNCKTKTTKETSVKHLKICSTIYNRIHIEFL